MSVSSTVAESVSVVLPFAATIVIVGWLLWFMHRILIGRHPDLGNERLFPRQIAMLGLSFAGVIAVALALPVDASSRNQVIGLIGLLVSGIFAFSSSTIFANLMGGVMLRVTKPFVTGDFVTVGGYFGRVAERGLLDTEIQTENRELVALPNTYMITNPVTVTHSSGAIVFTTLSLGYDVHHSTIESLLLEAARQCGLNDPFVQLQDLGDYSITYKVSGMLTDVKSLLTARSNLRRAVLDSLHSNGVEVLSPAFMNQRRVPDDMKIMPATPDQEAAPTAASVEELVFDKAEQAEKTEKDREVLLAEIKEYEAALSDADEEETRRIKERIAETAAKIKALQQPDS